MATSLQQILKERSSNLNKINVSAIDKATETAQRSLENGEKFEDVMAQLALCCADKALSHPQWSLLAGRLQMEIIHNEVPGKFSESTIKMKPILHPAYYQFVVDNALALDAMIIRNNDFNFNTFAISTLRKSYLAHLKMDDKSYLMETPQYMYMRVATYIHFPDMRKIKDTYFALSFGLYSHATPTLFNAGMARPQLSSCFLSTVEDNMTSITKAWHDQGIISMNSGGLGYDYNQIRHSEIGQHGFSRGVVPWLKITNEILKTVDQAGKRKGSGTIYLRDWHVDIYEFIELRDEGPEDMRAKDLFLGLMISDLFMKRARENGKWSLFCPNKVKGLSDKWGSDFEMTYMAAEQSKLYARQVNARELLWTIIKMQIKKGMPFILYMDACNRKSNQKHSGTIRCSNLCTEILEVTNKDEIASCNLASLCLNKCVINDDSVKYFDFGLLEKLTRELVRNLNNVIDRNYYPEDIPQIKFSNTKHRPIGIGVQGLADTFALLDISWIIPNPNPERPEQEDQFIVSPEAKELNDQIFETIYFAATSENVELAKEDGTYEAFDGSPASQGLFQFDLWEEERIEKSLPEEYDPLISENKRKRRSVSSRKKSRFTDTQWENLRQDMQIHGLRNSLTTAIMPTASSAHILENQECIEPITEIILARSVLSGQFIIENKHAVADLEAIGLWNNDAVKSIVENRGSLSAFSPENLNETQAKRLEFLKLKYATVFEIPQKILVDLAMDRAIYIDQTQSFNCHMARPTKKKMMAYHFYCWEKGAKTGMYYLRQKALSDPINFSVDTITVSPKESTPETQVVKPKKANIVCTDEICLSCGS